MNNKNYFDIDSILSEEEKITCTFLNDAYRLGNLDPGSGEEDIKKDMKIDLPFWMSIPLAERKLIAATMPNAYQEDFKNSLIADPNIMVMRNHPYYDRFGTIMGYLDTDLTQHLKKFTVSEKQIFQKGYRASIEYSEWKNRKGEKVITLSDNPGAGTATKSSGQNINNSSNISTTRTSESLLQKRKRFFDFKDD
eukprot:gene1457-1837_t